MRHATRRAHALAAFKVGYLADATHLRRREPVEHVATAAATGLVPRAVLTAQLRFDELLRRNHARPLDERVPAEVLQRQAHRRSLLSVDLLLDEGFASVHEVDEDGPVAFHERPGLRSE